MNPAQKDGPEPPPPPSGPCHDLIKAAQIDSPSGPTPGFRCLQSAAAFASGEEPLAMDNFATERAARYYLMDVALECGGSALSEFVAEVGSVEAAAQVRRMDAPPQVMSETYVRPVDAMPELDYPAMAERLGARLVIPEDSEWPAEVLSVLGSDPEAGRFGIPLGLWVRGSGDLAKVLERAVAMVGNSKPTDYGRSWGEALGRALGRARITVVSGTSLGISESAYRGAESEGGATVAVLPCGLSSEDPLSEVVPGVGEGGILLSEYPPDRLAFHWRVDGRSRLVACLGAGTVVVEDGAQSRRTAECAAELGRPVMAVRGPEVSFGSAWCNEMVERGKAVAVRSMTEIAEACGFLG